MPKRFAQLIGVAALALAACSSAFRTPLAGSTDSGTPDSGAASCDGGPCSLCTSNADCPAKTVCCVQSDFNDCDAGLCVPGCQSDSDCESPKICCDDPGDCAFPPSCVNLPDAGRFDAGIDSGPIDAGPTNCDGTVCPSGQVCMIAYAGIIPPDGGSSGPFYLGCADAPVACFNGTTDGGFFSWNGMSNECPSCGCFGSLSGPTSGCPCMMFVAPTTVLCNDG